MGKNLHEKEMNESIGLFLDGFRFPLHPPFIPVQQGTVGLPAGRINTYRCTQHPHPAINTRVITNTEETYPHKTYYKHYNMTYP